MNARKRCHRHGVAGKGNRDDTAKRANAVRPYGSWSTFLPVGNPQTFRREQAPALRCAVYLFARRDAPPGASGKGRLWHNVAGRGKRGDTPVHSLPQSRPLADPAPSEREPWVRAFIFSTILSLQAQHNKPSPFRGRCPAGADEAKAAFGTMSPGKAYGIPPTPL